MRAAAALCLVLASAFPAVAHTGGTTGYAAIAVDGATVRYTLTLWPATLAPGIAGELRAARDGDDASATRWLALVREKIVVSTGTRQCVPGEGMVRPPGPGVDSVIMTMDYACANPVRELVVRDDVFDVLGVDHHTLARIDAGGRTRQAAFAPDLRVARVSLDDASARGLGGFLWLGVEHIVTGWDHLLFLLALILPGGGLLALAKIVTAFTVAHSVTLSLAVLDVVRLPDRVVEMVIALSIAVVAAESVVGRATVRRRWLASFGFGLVHGFGFSGALRELDLPPDGLALALLGFNAGVEAGQVALIALTVPLAFVVRASGYERRLAWACSIAIAAVGVVLFVERALL